MESRCVSFETRLICSLAKHYRYSSSRNYPFLCISQGKLRHLNDKIKVAVVVNQIIVVVRTTTTMLTMITSLLSVRKIIGSPQRIIL